VLTLIEHGLVDEFRLIIDPFTLRGGKRIQDGRARVPSRSRATQPCGR
jgi:hypothetical protein